MKTTKTHLISAILAITVLLGVGEAALGEFIPISFTYNVSSDDRNSGFPVGDLSLGSVSIDGVPGQTVPFSIPTTGNNEWTGPGHHHMTDPGGTGWYTLDIPVHLSGIRSVATLMNQHWWSGTSARLEFIDANGVVQHTEQIVTNRDVRDWNTYMAGSIDPDCAQEVVRVSPGMDNTPDVMDMQMHELPEYFWAQGNELATIRVVDYAEWMTHQLILSGVTVSDDLVEIPEPTGLALLTLGGLSILRRR